MRSREGGDGERAEAPRSFSSRNFLKIIEDTGEVGFWWADLRGEHLDASPGLYRILGLDPRADVTFGFGLDMIHPDDAAAHGDQIAVLRGGQAIQREFRIIRPDHTQRWVVHRAEAVFDRAGRPTHGMGVVFDVTARHDAMQALLQRHDRLNALVTATAAVLWINNASGESSEMPQWMALTGQTHAQMQGLGWLDAVHPEDRARTKAAWITAVEHVTPFNTDYRVLCADGIYRWFNARGAPVLNRDGSVREWVGVCLKVPGQNRFGPRTVAIAPSSPTAAAALQPLTPAQVRAARGMTGLSKEELARRANVSVSTIVRLEDGGSGVRPRHETISAVRRTFEASGVEFTFDPGMRPGVREASDRVA